MYQLGWGQLNENQNQPDSILQWNHLQLDIVGFLAILGESAVVSTSQVATLSRMFFLPRLLPAPQALLRPSRPDKLQPISGQAVGVTSGNKRDYINFLGHVLANADSLPDYAVKCIKIKRIHNEGVVRARPFGPTWWVAVLGCVLSVVILAISVWQQDGMAILADICLSFLSTLVGVVNKWNLNLPKRAGDKNHYTPPGDVILRYPKGSFVVIRCSEDVARELFFAPEGIEYDIETPWKYRMIALVGSILLMFGVIFLGNARTNVQVAFAVAYMILNAAYWIIAALPKRFHWDTSAFEVIPEAFAEPQMNREMLREAIVKQLKEGKQDICLKTIDKDLPKTIPPKAQCKDFVSYNKTFTQALWKVIIATREIEWIRKSDAAPTSEAWDRWLALAHEVALNAPEPTNIDQKYKGKMRSIQHYHVPDWNAQGALIDALNGVKQQEIKKDQQKTATNQTQSDLNMREDPSKTV
ncbi:uncharacterized protein PV09_05135 [Verruconis gallopava]|uniref:Uncharacterized protein n=1 Tax=Verruconis gallopava TaxID=253628 RepID=A0A0D1XMP9_9PEZI|nr:uncharacterized protein PV09_05135 [Verruconis gallopava]KIW03836.1 hypothetical protein PV09_05135 [Verruconis gallopava]